MSAKQISLRYYLDKLSAEGTEVVIKCAPDARPVHPDAGPVHSDAPKGKIVVVGEDCILLRPPAVRMQPRSSKKVVIIPISAIREIEVYDGLYLLDKTPATDGFDALSV